MRPPKSCSAPRAAGATLRLPRVQMEARLLLFSSRLWAAFHTLAALFVPAVSRSSLGGGATLRLPRSDYRRGTVPKTWAAWREATSRPPPFSIQISPLSISAGCYAPLAALVTRRGCFPLGGWRSQSPAARFLSRSVPRCYAPPPRSVRRLSCKVASPFMMSSASRQPISSLLAPLSPPHFPRHHARRRRRLRHPPLTRGGRPGRATKFVYLL